MTRAHDGRTRHRTDIQPRASALDGYRFGVVCNRRWSEHLISRLSSFKTVRVKRQVWIIEIGMRKRKELELGLQTKTLSEACQIVSTHALITIINQDVCGQPNYLHKWIVYMCLWTWNILIPFRGNIICTE